ncbi:hypothetical protein [Streptomyces umbrinus]|uniref:hypothetical protein n=1 Tax=Streptomyces umbrinus TaxID=67370 RepID=UPI003405B61C
MAQPETRARQVRHVGFSLLSACLPADTSRRLRAIAARTGLEPERILAQRADPVRMDDNGTLTVDIFTPH